MQITQLVAEPTKPCIQTMLTSLSTTLHHDRHLIHIPWCSGNIPVSRVKYSRIECCWQIDCVSRRGSPFSTWPVCHVPRGTSLPCPLYLHVRCARASFIVSVGVRFNRNHKTIRSITPAMMWVQAVKSALSTHNHSCFNSIRSFWCWLPSLSI